MRKSILGGILSVLLVGAAVAAIYLSFARTSSVYRVKNMQQTMSFVDSRLQALEKQRDLLRETASTLEDQAAALHKRVELIDVELRNMRDSIAEGRQMGRPSPFTLKQFRFTTVTGLVVIAFLLLIWLLYGRVPGKEESAGEARSGEPASSEPGEKVTAGSLKEEEFPPVAEVRENEKPPPEEQES